MSRRSTERAQEVQQVVGILPGRVKAHVEVNGAEFGDDLLEALTKLSIAGGGFDELEFAGDG